jgi:site-specific recombinase XerD
LLLCRQIIDIPAKAARQKAMNYLSLEGIALLLSIPDTAKRQGRRDLVLLSLLYDTGARVQEIADVVSSDVRTEFPATIRLVGKGGKARIVPLSTDMAKLVRSYMNELTHPGRVEGAKPLFCNRSGQKMTRAGIAYILEKYADMARRASPGVLPDTLSPHCLRHSKAMHLLQGGVNLVYIRDLLGHADLRTTEIYARAESEAKRKALEKASPIKSNSAFPSWTEDSGLLAWLQSFGKAEH